MISFTDFDKLKELLATTITTISEEAKQKVIAHIATHLMEKDEQWIKKGLNLVDQTPPFCGKDFEGSEPLIELYHRPF